jgi:histidinol-phosphate aminotransferase
MGYLLSPSFLMGLIDQFPNCIFIVDEAYFEYSNSTIPHSFVESRKNIAITRSFSKAFSAASIRFGYLLASHEIIFAYDKVANPKAISLYAQVSAKHILDSIEYMHNHVSKVRENKKRFYLLLDKLDLKYNLSYGNFVLIEIPNEMKKNKLIDLLMKKNIHIRNFHHLIETKNHIRITIGSSSKFEWFMNIFGEIYQSA